MACATARLKFDFWLWFAAVESIATASGAPDTAFPGPA